MQDRINIDKRDRVLYERLDKEDMFKGKTRKEQFLFTMAVGFKNDARVPLETREGLFLIKDMKPDDEALINAVAIAATGSESCLLNKDDVYQIAEQYGHGGIRILIDKIDGMEFATFWKRFELELHQMFTNRGLAE
jgi:hypothetical protein